MLTFKGIKIRNLAMLTMLALVVPLAMISSFTEYFIQQEELRRHIDTELQIAATFAQQLLEADYHDRIEDKNSINHDEFDRLVNRNNELCTELELEYIWSLMVYEGQIVFTSSTSPDKKLPSHTHAKFFELHSNPEFYETAFQTMEPQFLDISDKWGETRAVLIPHYDSHGRKYLFGASKKLQHIEAMTSYIKRNTLITTAVFLLPGLLISLLASKWLTRPIAHLAEMAEKIGLGEHDQPNSITGSYEINVVSEQLNSMSTSIQEHIKTTEQSLKELLEFERIVNNSPAIAFSLDIQNDFKTIFISKNIAKAGYSAKDFMSGKTSWEQIVPENALQQLLVAYEKAIAEEQSSFVVSNTKLIWATGEIRDQKNWYQIIRDENETPIKLQGMSLDITEQVRAKEHEALYLAQLNTSLHEMQEFKNTVNSSPIIIFRLGFLPGKWPVEFISNNISLLGYSKNDLLSGKITWLNINHPDDISHIECIVTKALENKQDTFNLVSRIITASGEIRYMESWNRFIRDESGNVLQIQGLFKDVTETHAIQERNECIRSELEQAVLELQEFEHGVNAGPVVLFKLNLKNHFATEFISENISIAGYTAEGVMNNQPPFASIIPEQSLLILRERLGEAIAKGKESYSIQTDIIYSDGSIQPHLNWYRIIKDENGSPSLLQGMSLSIKDLTEGKLREDAYQKEIVSKVRELQGFHQIVTSSPILIYRTLLDENTTVEFLSDNYSMLGYDIEQLRAGKLKLAALSPPEDLERARIIAKKALEAGNGTYSSEIRVRWADGSIHWYKCWNQYVRDESGQPTKIQGILTEITDLIQAKERDKEYQVRLRALSLDLLRVEDKERRRLAISLHDDIGQMLAALNMKLSVLKETSDRELIDSLIPQVDELLILIMSTCKTLTWEISPTSLYETDIAAGLERMADELENFFGLQIKLETMGARIVLDRDSAAFIFRCAKELMVNIAKHAGVKNADVGISQYGDKVHLVVSDSGVGFKIDSLTEKPGRGFGLFSIRERIEQMNGSIHIESAPGKGSKVMVILPLDISALI